jgi:hypothetical protein
MLQVVLIVLAARWVAVVEMVRAIIGIERGTLIPSWNMDTSGNFPSDIH